MGQAGELNLFDHWSLDGVSVDQLKEIIGEPSMESPSEIKYVFSTKFSTTRALFDVIDGRVKSSTRPRFHFEPGTDVEVIIHVLSDEYRNQAGIMLDPAVSPYFGSGGNGVDRPSALVDGVFNQTAGTVFVPNIDEDQLVLLKDNDYDTIDVFVLQTGSLVNARATTYGKARNQTGNTAFNNWIVLDSEITTNSPHTLAHEIMHVLLNSIHRPADPATALFYGGGTSQNKNVLGTKRIGPYPDATTNGVGASDRTSLRSAAEALP